MVTAGPRPAGEPPEPLRADYFSMWDLNQSNLREVKETSPVIRRGISALSLLPRTSCVARNTFVGPRFLSVSIKARSPRLTQVSCSGTSTLYSIETSQLTWQWKLACFCAPVMLDDNLLLEPARSQCV